MSVLRHFSLLRQLLFLALAGPGAAWAYLGSFETSDGYRVPSSGNILSLNFLGDAQFYLGNNAANGVTGIVAPGAYPHTLGDSTHGMDVSRYNAGQHGTGGGGPGGTATDIADNSGLWRALAGGRLNEDLGAPFYLGGPFQRDYIAAYAYTGARTGDQVLNLLAYDEDMRYAYSLDSRDFDGIDPALTSDMRIELSFWTCPTDADDLIAAGDNTVAMSFKDSIGQILLDVGYTGDNLLQYRIGGAATWQTTAISLGTQGWSEILVTLDTHANSISLAARAFSDINTALEPTTTVLIDESLSFNTDNVTEIEWFAADVDGFKNFFDDFNFNLTAVPEPGSAVLLLLAGLFGIRRRR
jgi:hypothetical protein